MPLDAYQRDIRYLRVSVTDACNLRCVYCMPEGMAFRPGSALLQDDELKRLLAVFARLGFVKIRFTGGEPTLRSSIVELIRVAAAQPGVRQVGLTTNGVQLRHLARPMREAGLRTVNVSLDTLDPARFRQLTRWGHVQDVLDGIAAATREGLEVKLNAVVVRGLNDGDDVMELAGFALERGLQIRFIEMMPLGGLATYQTAHAVTEAELLERLADRWPELAVRDEGRLDGEARVFAVPGLPGAVGFISPVSAPFCAGCNRVRLTADGMLRLCLLREQEADVRSALRRGLDDTALGDFIVAAIHRKPWGHGLADGQVALNRAMSEIGG